MAPLLAACLIVGAAARRLSFIPSKTPWVVNRWVLFVALPALIVKTVHRVEFQRRFFVAAALMWAVFGLTALGAVAALRRGWLNRETAGAVALSGGLGNTAFVGIPLIGAMGGQAAAGIATMVDQFGTFLAFAFGAVPFAMAMGGTSVRLRAVLKRVLMFPSFVALLSALALRPLTFPASLETGLGWLSATLTPLAMVSVGWQLEFRNLRGQVRVLVTGLLWKLVVVPALVLLALRTFDGPLTVVDRVAIAQAAMAPMMTAAVLAAEYRLAATLSAAMAALGVLLSFATVPAWWALSGALG